MAAVLVVHEAMVAMWLLSHSPSVVDAVTDEVPAPPDASVEDFASSVDNYSNEGCCLISWIT